MKVIMFAGGTGKRFWPASRKNNPKQFQAIIDNKPLIKLKYEYLRLGFKPEDIFISTGAEYESEVREIISELPYENFIFEPTMRDNGPAILYATAIIHKRFPNEVISTQWVDHYVKYPELFAKALIHAEEMVRKEDKTVIIGVPARFPSPHLGYIKFGSKIKSLDDQQKLNLYEFIKFVEKPTVEIAIDYIKSGDYAWNPGYFVTTTTKLMEKYKVNAPDIYNKIMAMSDANFSEESKKEYLNLEKISFDYIFAENLEPEEALVLNVDMGWSDVGEWIALKETLEDSKESNVSVGEGFDMNSKDTIIYNTEEGKLVATIGLEGMIVVNTPDVVAVFHKNDNTKLKEFLKKLEEGGLANFL